MTAIQPDPPKGLDWEKIMSNVQEQVEFYNRANITPRELQELRVELENARKESKEYQDGCRVYLDRIAELEAERQLHHAYSPALIDVLRERVKQDAKWGEQNHDPFTYICILLEEMGEMSQAAVETKFGGKNGGLDNLRKEAIHSAAVALAIVECLDRKKWNWPGISYQRQEEK